MAGLGGVSESNAWQRLGNSAPTEDSGKGGSVKGPPPGAPPGLGGVSQEEIEKVLAAFAKEIDKAENVMSTVIALLIAMVETLQRIGMGKAEHLKLGTNMQKLYTDLIDEAPVYRKDAPNPPENKIFNKKDSEKDAQDRANANANVAIWTDQLRAHRDQWGDQTKMGQAALEATNRSKDEACSLLSSLLKLLTDFAPRLFK